MDGTVSTHGKMRNACDALIGKSGKKCHLLGVQGIDGRIILK
jgi:hypothetical protein